MYHTSPFGSKYVQQEQPRQDETFAAAAAGWPYPPSWVDRLHSQIERLPGPGWLLYPLLALFLVLTHAAIKWGDGSYSAGTFHPFHVVVMISGVWYLALVHYLNWVANRAMGRFRPVLEGGESRYNELAYSLLTLPARPTLVVTLAGLLYRVLMVVGVARGLVFTPEVLVFTSPVARWFEGAIGLLVCLSFSLFVYHTIHQVRVVNRIYTTSTVIDLFNLTPIHVFSVLTAQTASGGLLIAYTWIVTEPGFAGDKFSLIAMLTTVALALFAFLWPLLGVHRLLVAEKIRAQTEVGQRVKTCFAELHRRIDDQLSVELEPPVKAMAGLQQEQDWLVKISTWPWEPETIRWLATAVFLPMVLWFITRLLERFLDF